MLSPHLRAVLGLLATVLAVATAVAAPGTAGTPARTATAVSGWSTATVTVPTGAVHRTRVRVSGGARSVLLQRRAGRTWRTVDVARSTAAGHATLAWATPDEPSDVALRVRVPATVTRRAATTPLRVLRVRTPTPATAEPPTPSEPTGPTTPEPTTPDPTTPDPTTDPTDGPTAYQREVLDLTNQARAAGAACGGVRLPPAAALSFDARLGRAAGAHARSMASGDYFSHTGSDGSSAGDRIGAEGYRWRTWGENIAAGHRSPADVVRGWLASPGHCRNLMNGAFTQLGVGYAADSSSTYGSYWVQVLAAPR